ncbi:MAG: phosphatidylserine decarboxylase [Rhodanobacteraceae bacterium]|nr:phosphatidylserine decarboxylase [Rhodanobacteraceae bacterium]MBK7044018.1 phosphatidylserine decarboxylase [Rhodanobacteraceae bacterium]MBP9156066.1 phosphatidylserine decarboxylase [Xanthomonadales bacterium]HQW81914.1 archaetidylserine decarboxylase [Pseudomonadota bacterium]
MSPFIALQYLLPHRLLSTIALRVARIEAAWFKNAMIRFIANKFGVDWSEAASDNLDDYAHFNAFFTRALKPGARLPADDAMTIVMPADGRISQCGPIRYGRLFQAKGFDFSAEELLADSELAKRFDGGVFATVYLSPRDYHRVHMPYAGRLLETRHVPGRLFSVGTSTVAQVPRVFARNERLVCVFDTEFGPMAVVMVGALLVSGVETVWRGVEIPAYADQVIVRDYRDTAPAVVLERFAEMARFNYGSTVIVLLPPGATTLDRALSAEVPVRLGQALAQRLT